MTEVGTAVPTGDLESSQATAFRAVLETFTTHGKLRLFALLAYGIGLTLRYKYVVAHHPRHHATSDAGELVQLADRLLSSPKAQAISDTIWPPGASAILAWLKAFEPTLGLAALVQVLLSATMPLLVAHTAWLVAGSRAASWALILSALHLGFIHYGGFFLSEQLFQFAVAVAVWLSVAALRLAEEAAISAEPRSKRLLRFGLLGAAPGLAWGFASSIRPNAAPIALLVGALLAIHAWQRREGFRFYLMGGGLVAMLLVLAPLAHRCSALSGSFCPVSNNVAMNIALGQAGELGGLEFRSPQHPELSTTWFPPALLHHGYTKTEQVPAAIYETGALLRWVWQRFRDNPAEFAVRAAGNVLDLFRFEYWPDTFAVFSRRFVTVQVQAFLLLVVVPGLMACARLSRRALGQRATSAVPLFLCGVLLAVAGVAAFSLGEPRYRIPFDGILITMAAAMFAGVRSGALAKVGPSLERYTRPAVALAGATMAAMAALVITMSHPALGVGRWLSSSLPVASFVAKPTLSDAAEHTRVRAAGSQWDKAGNHVFTCRPHCSELRLGFHAPQSTKSVEVSVDSNDRYLVTFYRNETLLARTEVPVRNVSGMRVERLTVPAVASGFDAVGVLPLYGDGSYSLGHLLAR
ncbi:MAG TPA: hypothetical protein VM686_19860 [Polyangiaceae bacterium]|nr:hypothetical protein [Polyangiaceae bacterium]